MASLLVNEQTPLSDEQRDALESMLKSGHVAGVTSVYWALIGVMGKGAPNKDQISKWMREHPEVQTSRMVKRAEGKKNSGGPIIPQPAVISYIAADTLFIPAAFHTDKKVHAAAILYVCALSKYIYVIPCNLQNEDRPMSTTVQKGVKEFISRVRRAAKNDDLHLLKIRTDSGSEFVGGAYKAWLNSRRMGTTRGFTSILRRLGVGLLGTRLPSGRFRVGAGYCILSTEPLRSNGTNGRCRASSAVSTGCHTAAALPSSTMSAGTIRFVLNQLVLRSALTQLRWRRGNKS